MIRLYLFEFPLENGFIAYTRGKNPIKFVANLNIIDIGAMSREASGLNKLIKCK